MDLEEIRAKAFEATYPLKSVQSPIYFGDRTNAGRELPEYYLVYLLLVDLLGFHHQGRHEKVAWSIPVELEGQVLFIEYRKLGLGIFSTNRDGAEEVSREVVRLVKQGARAAQPYFDFRVEEAIKASEINVKNRSLALYERFQFFLELYKASVSAQGDSKEELSFSLWSVESATTYNQQIKLQRQIRWLALAVIESFYSWTEHMFIHFAILRGQCTTGDCIKKLVVSDWKTKFKSGLDISEPKLKFFYDKLGEIRVQVRNFVAHGAFGKEGDAFRFHSGTGAVPVLLPHREGNHSYRVPSRLDFFRTSLSFSDQEAISLIQEFIEFIQSGPTASAWIYLHSGLDTVLTMANSGAYDHAMKSKELMTEFTEYLDYVEDIHLNMDF